MSDSDSYSDEPPSGGGIDSAHETHFDPDDAPAGKKRKARRLWFYNENLKRDRNNTNSEEVRRRERNHILDAVSSSLAMPEYQHEEAKTILSQSNFTDSVAGRYLSIETYCFAICVLVHNQNVRDFSKQFLPEKSEDLNPNVFSNVQSEIGVDMEELEQALEELEYDVVKNV